MLTKFFNSFHIYNDTAPQWDYTKEGFDSQSPDVQSYFVFEYLKMRRGVSWGSVKVHPWLYWHLNYFTIPIDVHDPHGGPPTTEYQLPPLRDNEWIINEHLIRAEIERKGLCIYGSRRISKSVFEASFTSYNATIRGGGEARPCVIYGENQTDLKNIVDYITVGMKNTHPFFNLYPPTTTDFFSEKGVRFGYKDTRNVSTVHANIVVNNLGGGSQKSAGQTPMSAVFDEIGKFNIVNHFNVAKIALNTPMGWRVVPLLSGCVCKGTKVWLSDGSVKNIEDIKKSDSLLGFDGKKVTPQKVNWLKPKTKKDCYRITTDDNTIIECSYDHPFLISRCNLKKTINGVRKRKVFYQEANKIEHNDQLIVPLEVPFFGNKKLNNARLIGLMIGDGNYSLNCTPSLSVSEIEIYNYVKEFISNESHEYIMKNGNRFSQVYLKGITNQLKDIGIYGQTKDSKRLPNNIHEYDKQSLAELLAGYFDADGNVHYRKSKGIVRVVLTSVVKELLEQVKLQLVKFGVHSSVVKEKRNQKPQEEYKGQKPYIYRLYINQQQDVIRFRENIPLLVKSKRDKLNLVTKLKYSEFDAFFVVNPLNNKEGYFNRDNPEDIVLTNLRYETVKKVEYIGEKYVYNLNCGLNHNYLSNNFITRQTGGDIKLSQPSQQIFTNPDLFNLIKMDWSCLDNHCSEPTWKSGQTCGLFIPGQFSLNFPKKETTLAVYLKAPEVSYLNKIKILETDYELATPKLLKDLELAEQTDSKTYLDLKTHLPLDMLDCFLASGNSPFNTAKALDQKIKLQNEGNTSFNFEISLGPDGNLKLLPASPDKVQAKYPFPGGNIDCPVQVFISPPKNPELTDNMFVGGLDDYKQDKSNTDSLGTHYIVKRTHGMNDQFSYHIACSYASRPESHTKFHETVRTMQLGYGARTLQEGADLGYEKFLELKYKEQLPQLLLDGEPIAIGSKRRKSLKKQNIKYGLTPIPKHKQLVLGAVVRYVNEEVEYYDEETGQKYMDAGVYRIKDIGLLDEIISYMEGNNVDRITAFGHALLWAEYLDSKFIKATDSSDKQKEQKIKKPERQIDLREQRLNMQHDNRMRRHANPILRGRR